MRGVYIQKKSPFYWVRYYDKMEADPKKRAKSLPTKIEITNADRRRYDEAKAKGEKAKLQGTPELRELVDAFRRDLLLRDIQVNTGVEIKLKVKLSDGLQKFIEERTVPGRKGELKPKTIEQYRLAVKHLIDCCGDKAIDKYSMKGDYFQLLKYFESYKREVEVTVAIKDKKKVKEKIYKEMAQNSRSIYTRALHSLWEYFIAEGYAAVNIIEKVKEEEKDPDPIPLDDLAIILRALKANSGHPHHYHIIAFMLLTGCRPSSAVVQMREDILYDRKIVKIQNVKTGKRKNKSFYNFPCYHGLYEFLTQDMGIIYTNPGRLFPQFSFSDMSYTNSLKFWDRLNTDLKLKEKIRKKYILKQLRPSTASFLVNVLGMDPFSVMKLLDHTDIKVTDKHYIDYHLNIVRNDLDSLSINTFLEVKQVKE